MAGAGAGALAAPRVRRAAIVRCKSQKANPESVGFCPTTPHEVREPKPAERPWSRSTPIATTGELAELRERLLLMGAKVEDMLAGSVRAFAKRDTDVARSTIELDREVDALEIEIDAHCLRVLALWKPVASDLRFITTVLKLVTHLERIGDLAEAVCRHAIELNREPSLPFGPSVATAAGNRD